ncbi:hypothetical protein JZ00_25790 [Pseudomonas frederiksbergensis]|uniref:Uncharacterized protein n=1 Tax=Pseudomonas frederiksbergensis TaxID=104087 RepID=A0A0B1YYD6_9PSED|nr:hypothetical protein JZ00_25790 [Pseudomonas frederiksbergensis]
MPGRLPRVALPSRSVCMRIGFGFSGGIGGDLDHDVQLHSKVEFTIFCDQAEGWRTVRRLVDQGMEPGRAEALPRTVSHKADSHSRG